MHIDQLLCKVVRSFRLATVMRVPHTWVIMLAILNNDTP